jgi:hypothetical protein
MPTPSTTTEISITPKHARLQAFLAGKGINYTDSDKPVKVEVSNTELTSLMRKAEVHGFEDLIKAPKAAVKKAEKAQEKAAETGEAPEPREPEESTETTADQELEEASDEAPKRRRRQA